MRSTWRDHIRTVTEHIRNHNWLPVAVGAIVVAWLGLLLANLNVQPGPAAPALPSGYAQAHSDESINVGYKTDTPNNLSVGKSTSGSKPTTNWSNEDVATSASTTAPATSTTAATDEIVGGRGADEPGSTTTTPADTGSSTTTPPTDTTTVPGVDLGVETPIIDVNLNLGGDTGLDLDVGLPIL